MRLDTGTRLGNYEVVAPLGAGGMGEVYRARDATLRRDVAIKVVNPQYCAHPDSRDRLRREARALAALNHPHVAAVHEFGESDSGCYIVMEYVAGQTLLDVLEAGPPSLHDSLRTCLQVATALEAAHDRGLIHRDLKPANVRVTPEGIVKVLDFGLARQDPAVEAGDLDHPSTFGTEAGSVVGTASYMSPEQARGRPVDRRTDIWAFGCLLFELLAGRRVFSGPTTSDTFVAILEREPEWSLLPHQTPPAIRRLLRRCLEKDAARRLRDMGDARLEIEDALSPAGAEPQGALRTDRRLSWVTLAAAVLLGAAAGGALARFGLPRPAATPSNPPARFVVPLGFGARLSQTDFPALAMSADGAVMAYAARRGDRSQLFVRRLDAPEPVAVAGSTDAVSPFFSPDGQWIAFFADGKLKKAPIAGGPAVTVCDAAIGFGGSWGPDNTIVFASAPGSPLWRVSSDGGIPARLTRLDADGGEFSHRWPHILPNGRAVLFTVGTEGSFDDALIVAESLDGGARTVVVKGGTHPHYVPSGHVLYTRGGVAWAVPFDQDQLTTSGAPVEVLDDVLTSFDGASQLSVSANGTLVYIAGNAKEAARRLTMFDGTAGITPLAAPPRAFVGPRVSPDGRRVAVTIAGALEEVWVYDIATGALDQVTFESINRAPIWTPDGQRLVFSSNRAGALNLFIAPVDGSAPAERLTTSDNIQFPGSWSSDGSLLAFVEHHPTTGRDIWLMRFADGRQSVPLIASPFDETSPALSPDGRWVAYVTNQSGRPEVRVRATTDSDSDAGVSADGSEPVWSRDGRELFVRTGERLVSVAVTLGARIQIARPTLVLDGGFAGGTADRANFDVAPSGRRLVLVADSDQGATPGELIVLLNWAIRPPTP